MKSAASPGSFSALIFNLTAALSVGVLMVVSTSCGAGPSSSTRKLTGNTNVTVVLSSTANDQLSEFDLAFQGIALTSQSGQTVTLLSTPSSGSGLGAEFIHLNGNAEPLLTANIPQGVYTSGTVSLGLGADFVCLALGPVNGQEVLETTTYNATPSAATVNFPSPITVTGATMGLSLDLVVAQSATYSSCLNPNGFYGYSITPSFTLTPLTFSASPTNAGNGKMTGLDGQITAIGSNGSSFTLSVPDAEGARALAVSAGRDTVYQGISSASVLAVGTFLDMDGAIQSDGSVMATRISVPDAAAVNVLRGPLMEVTSSASVFLVHPRQRQGADLQGFGSGSLDFKFGSAAFAISGQLSNLGSLPFVPTFNATNMVPGQEVYVSAAAIPSGGYPTSTTITLMPQTINGTVTGSSKLGNFTDYTVSLASYDLFPMLAVQPGQTTVENNPSQVEVYVNNNTQLLNTAALASGNTLRFYGLVFNDNGTLRMDCAQVSDGVTSSSQSNSKTGLTSVQARTLIYRDFGQLPNAETAVTRSR